MMKNKIIILGICLAAVSCGTLKKYTPVSEVSDSLYGVAANGGEESLGDIKWQEFFSDAYLRDLIGKAIENNLDLKAALEHITQSEAMLRSAKLSYIPTLGLNPTFSLAAPLGKDSKTSYEYNIAASSSWQLDIFRKITNQRAAETTVEQMNDYYQAVQSQLVSSVANTYYTMLMVDSQLVTSIEMQMAWEESVRMVKAMKDAGLADQVAVSQYVANLENINITVLTLQNQLVQIKNAMSLLLSEEPGKDYARGKLINQRFDSKIALGAPVRMLTRRPDVRAAERDIEQAYYTTRGAVLNFFPSLTINGSIGLVNPSTGELSPMSVLGGVGAGIVAPIINAGVNKAALDIARSRQNEAKLAFENILLTAGNEVNNAYSDYNTCKAAEENYLIRVAALDKARRDTEYLMRNSLDKTYLDVLFAYTNFFDAKLGAIANQAQKMQAVVNLYTALGGGAL